MTSHLNHEQLCDLLLAGTVDLEALASPELDRLREHVRDCHICAAELSQLDRSLNLFRSTADAWASHQWHGHQTLLQNSALKPGASTNGLLAFFSRPVIWATAMAIVLLCAALPITLHYLPEETKTSAPAATVLSTKTSQSDEALLEEIDQTLSSTVPAPMQPLADPTADRGNQSNNTQRKN